MEFYAPWCPHCQHFAPEVERLGQAYNTPSTSTVLVCRVSCVAQSSICNHMGIRGFPTMFFGTPAQFISSEKDGSYDTLLNTYPHTLDHTAVAVSGTVVHCRRRTIGAIESHSLILRWFSCRSMDGSRAC